jgi:hypothetical protein
MAASIETAARNQSTLALMPDQEMEAQVFHSRRPARCFAHVDAPIWPAAGSSTRRTLDWKRAISR